MIDRLSILDISDMSHFIQGRKSSEESTDDSEVRSMSESCAGSNWSK